MFASDAKKIIFVPIFIKFTLKIKKNEQVFYSESDRKNI